MGQLNETSEDWLAGCRCKLRRAVCKGKCTDEALQAIREMEEKRDPDDIPLKYEARRWTIAMEYLQALDRGE